MQTKSKITNPVKIERAVPVPGMFIYKLDKISYGDLFFLVLRSKTKPLYINIMKKFQIMKDTFNACLQASLSTFL